MTLRNKTDTVRRNSVPHRMKTSRYSQSQVEQCTAQADTGMNQTMSVSGDPIKTWCSQIQINAPTPTCAPS